MDTHAVREMCLEEVVITASDFGNGFSQLSLLAVIQVDERALVLLADDHGLKRPCRPPRAEHQEGLVLEDNPFLFLALKSSIILQHVLPAMLASVLLQLLQFHRRLLRQRTRGPDLAVGMRIRAPHGRTLVLEYLHISILLLGLGQSGRRRGGGQGSGGRERGERRRGRQVGGVEIDPSVDDRRDFGRRQVRQGEVVGGRKGENVAFARHGLSLEEGRFQGVILRVIRGLFLLDCAVVVHEDESTVILRVGVALRALIPGAEITGGIVGRQGCLGGAFLVASVVELVLPGSCQAKYGIDLLPWSLGSMGRNQNVGTPKRIVSPVGDVVEDFLSHGHCEEYMRYDTMRCD